MFFSLFIYSKFTSLGDTGRWMDGNIENFDISILLNSTKFIDFFGGLSSQLLGNIFGNFPFLLLSFYGIYYSVSKITLNSRQLMIILILLSFPSFGVWSSIAGKEAIGVFYMGIILGYIIDLLEDKNRKIKFIEYIAIYLLLIFKAQYFIAIFSLFIFIKLSYLFHLKVTGKNILFLFYLLFIVSSFYYFREMINDLSFTIPANFSLDAASTRENTIWVNDYDIFYNAPYGMFIGFFGPTFSEVLQKPIQSIAFIESLVIILLFVYFLLKIVLKGVNTSKINIFVVFMVFITLFCLLFVHYPVGVLNPGSALRYRENFYGFLVVFLFYLNIKFISRKNYV